MSIYTDYFSLLPEEIIEKILLYVNPMYDILRNVCCVNVCVNKICSNKQFWGKVFRMKKWDVNTLIFTSCHDWMNLYLFKVSTDIYNKLFNNEYFIQHKKGEYFTLGDRKYAPGCSNGIFFDPYNIRLDLQEIFHGTTSYITCCLNPIKIMYLQDTYNIIRNGNNTQPMVCLYKNMVHNIVYVYVSYDPFSETFCMTEHSIIKFLERAIKSNIQLLKSNGEILNDY